MHNAPNKVKMRNLSKDTIVQWRKHGFTHILTVDEEQDEDMGIRHLLVQPTHEPGDSTIPIQDADWMVSGNDTVVVQYLPLLFFEVTLEGNTFLICEELYSDHEIAYSVSQDNQPQIPTFHLRINDNGVWRITEPDRVPEKIRWLEDRLSDAILSQNL